MEFYRPKSNSYEGFETWFNALKLKIKMHTRIVSSLLMASLVIYSLNIFITSTYETEIALKWSWARMVYKGFPDSKIKFKKPDGSKTVASARSIAANPRIHQIVKPEISRLKWNFAKILMAVFLLYPIILMVFKKRSVKQSNKRYIRGAKIISPTEFSKKAKKRKEKLDLPLGAIKMPVSLENRHTLIIGKPGSGKTQCLRPIINRLYDREEKGIIYDKKGDYFSEFFNPDRDFLFNPLDQRSLGWNLFNELTSYPDVDAVAASLVPPPIASTDPFWGDAARGVFSGILHYLYQRGAKNNKALWQLLTADAQEIAQTLKRTKGGEAGYRYITQNAENSKQAESVLAVMMQYTKCFEYMAENEGGFQINDWLYNGRGMIYITNYENIEETLKPILSLFVDLIGRKILSMPDDINRRVFFNLDEFGSLQRLSTIVNLLTGGRSKGACVFLGIQDDGQTEKIYTPQIRKSIDNACGNRITFALTGETAEREAKYNIGETEYMETDRAMSMGPHDMRDGISLSERKKRELLMLPSEIANLPDLEALIRLKNYDFVKSYWQWEAAKQIHDPFILREDLFLENIVSVQENIKEHKQDLIKTSSNFNIKPI